MNALVSTAARPRQAPRKATASDWVPAEYDLRDAWFPVAHALDVGAAPIRRIVHAQPYFLWRDGSGVKAAEFHPERMAQSKSLATAFTGGSGYYPTVERYGYVWAWYGAPDAADEALLPHIPFLPLGGSPRHMCRTVRFDVCSALAVENLIDSTHADFLHGEVVGGEGVSYTDEVKVEFTSETVTRTRMVTHKAVSPIMRWVGGVRAKYQDYQSVLHLHIRSSTTLNYARFRPGFDVPTVQPFVPVGANRCRVDVAFNVSAAPEPFRHIMPRMAYVVGPQDDYVLTPQNARYADPSPQRDLHSRFDAPGNRYRFQIQQLWERQQAGDFSYLADGDPQRDVTALLGMDG